MEDLNSASQIDSTPASRTLKKNNLRPVKFIIVFLTGILAARGIFFILDKRIVKPKTAYLSPKPQIAPSLISAASERHNLSTKNVASKIKENIKKTASAASTLSRVSFPELRLNGIAASGKSGWAIINGRVVKPGDKIEGAEVAGITEEKVYLDFNDESFTLTLE